MQFVKVLDKDLCPLIQGGKPYKIGVWNHCENFDRSETECAPGFYVIPVSELIHYHRPLEGTKVLPVEVKGDSKYFSPSKQRYEHIKLSNPLSDEEIKAMCKEIEPELGYKLSEALYPINSLLLPKATVNDEDLELLKQWNSVWGSVWGSVGDSVWDSVWDNVRDSVWDNVCDSIQDSIWDSAEDSIFVYVGSLFPNIQKWKYIDHEIGEYPFQPAVDLWHRGLIPVFDDKKWKLLSGEKAEIVWEEPEIGWLKAQEEE